MLGAIREARQNIGGLLALQQSAIDDQQSRRLIIVIGRDRESDEEARRELGDEEYQRLCRGPRLLPEVPADGN